MPLRIPPPTRIEMFSFGAAGVTGFAPLYLMTPRGNDQMHRQTDKWAPRWERNISMFKSPMERSIQKVTPPVARTVQRVENRLPMDKIAQKTDRGIKKGLDRMSAHINR